MTELWDVYDSSGTKTGLTKVKGGIFDEGEYHLGVDVWIVNQNAEFLIQKRAQTKRIHPDMWATTCGSVIACETGLQACVREVKEEIGIDIRIEQVKALRRTFGKDNIWDIYIVEQDFPLGDTTIQENEVSEVRWAPISEIKELWKQGLLMHDRNELQLIFSYVENRFEIEKGKFIIH